MAFLSPGAGGRVSLGGAFFFESLKVFLIFEAVPVGVLRALTRTLFDSDADVEKGVVWRRGTKVHLEHVCADRTHIRGGIEAIGDGNVQVYLEG